MQISARFLPCMKERNERESTLDTLRAHTAGIFAATMAALADGQQVLDRAVDAPKTAFDQKQVRRVP